MTHEPFKNLLDKAGRKFYAEALGLDTFYDVYGTIEVNGRLVILKPSNIDYVTWQVGIGSPEDLANEKVFGFRLLEPESKEEKCPNCNGVPYFKSQHSGKMETCNVCSGTGTIKKDEDRKFIQDFASKTLIVKEGCKRVLIDNEPAKDDFRIMAEDVYQALIKSKSNSETLTKRENISTQLLAGMLGNSNQMLVDRLTVNGGYFHEQYVIDAIELTDLLLKKLGE